MDQLDATAELGEGLGAALDCLVVAVQPEQLGVGHGLEQRAGVARPPERAVDETRRRRPAGSG